MKPLFVLLTALLMAAPAAALPLPYYTYVAMLSGANEATPNASPGTGFAEVTPYPTVHMLEVIVDFSGLTAGSTASHIHCCTATPDAGTAGVATPVPTFPLFPTGVTSGSYDQIFDMTLATSYNPTFLAIYGGDTAAAEAALLAGLADHTAYLNIHTGNYPGGEIRGFFETIAIDYIPEPASLALLGAGLIGAFRLRRKKLAA